MHTLDLLQHAYYTLEDILYLCNDIINISDRYGDIKAEVLLHAILLIFSIV